MKLLVVRLTTLSLLGAAVLTSLPAFADNMGTAGADNDQTALKSSSDVPSPPPEFDQHNLRRRRR